MRTIIAALSAVSLILAAACEEPTSPEPLAVRIEVTGDTNLIAGVPVTFTAPAYDAAGNELDDLNPIWAVLDPLYARVTAMGEVTGLRPGTTGVEVRLGTLADTAWFRVRWPELGRGEGRGTVMGKDTADFLWQGLAKVHDALGTVDHDESLLTIYSSVVGEDEDTTISVRLPYRVTTGSHVMSPYPLGGGALVAPSAILAIDTDSGRRVYYGLGGILEVDEADYPERPGHTVGSARATLSFHATRYMVDPADGPGGEPIATADTIHVTAQVRVDLQHLARPWVEVALTGGPVAGTAVRTHGHTAEDGHGGHLIWWDIDLDGVPSPWPWEASQEIRVSATGLGDHSVAPLDPATYADPDAWPPAFSVLYYRDHALVGLSDSGTVTLTRWLPHTDAYYGELFGTLTTTLRLWDPEGGDTGEIVQAVVSFAIPRMPGAGLPN